MFLHQLNFKNYASVKIVNEIITVGINFNDGNLVLVFADRSVGVFLPTNLHFHAPAEHILDGI